MIADFQQRIIIERLELSEKITALSRFTCGATFAALGDRQKRLLRVQLNAMTEYFDALTDRLLDMGVKL